MSAAPAIVHTAREQWLMRRRELVTASDVPAILGIGGSPSDVYVEKVGLADAEAETWPMFYGLGFQDGIGRAYARKTGRPVQMESLEIPEITIHPDLPWLGCTLDGKTAGSEKTPTPVGCGGPGTFEAKASSVAYAWDPEELPEPFLVQNTVQSACAGTEWGAIAAFVSLREAPRTQDVVFDRELFDLMVPRLEEFHWRVRERKPPVDQPGWFSSEAIKRIWSANNGTEIVLDEEAVVTATEWRKWKDAESEAKEKASGLGDLLRLKLAGAAVGWLPGGCAVALSNVRETFVEAHKKAAHTRLLYKQPSKGRK